MKKHIKKIMDDHETKNPHEKELNELALKDFDIHGLFLPSHPLIMHAAYLLDGGHHRRDIFHKNYHKHLSKEEKEGINEELLELAETSAMLHDPNIIHDDSHPHFSEDRALAKDVLEHMEESEQKEIKDHLRESLLKKHLDDLFHEESMRHTRLHPMMVHETGHHPEKYGHVLNHLLIQGALDNKWD